MRTCDVVCDFSELVIIFVDNGYLVTRCKNIECLKAPKCRPMPMYPLRQKRHPMQPAGIKRP